MPTVSPPYTPLVSIHHHSMRDVRETIRSQTLEHFADLSRSFLATGWTNRVIDANTGGFMWRYLKGLDPASVAKFVRNLRPNRDERKERRRKKWYSAVRRLVAVVPTSGGDYWLLIPGEREPRDGSGSHVGVFVYTDIGYVCPSAFEYAAPHQINTEHQRLYRPDHGTYELRGHVPRFTTALQTLKTRYLTILEANPADPRL